MLPEIVAQPDCRYGPVGRVLNPVDSVVGGGAGVIKARRGVLHAGGPARAVVFSLDDLPRRVLLGDEVPRQVVLVVGHSVDRAARLLRAASDAPQLVVFGVVVGRGTADH